MTKIFRCRDGGVVCRVTIRGESDDEVLKKAVEHARKAHGVDLTQSQTLVRYAASLVKSER